MLERVPDGQDDWRPHQKSKSIGELATHLAQLPGFGIMMLTQDEFDGARGRPQPSVANSAERLKLFDSVSGELRRQLERMTWEPARSPGPLRGGAHIVFQAPRSGIFRTVFITHSAHHRAQLGVYLRLLGIPVPVSYGPTADEQV